MLYWVVAAHVYKAAEIGRTSALVSAMMLISAATQMNLASVLIRFMARAGTATRRLVVLSYVGAVAVAVVVTAVFLVVMHYVVKTGNAFHVTGGFGAWFIAATAAWSVFALQDAALTGLRRSIWVPVENATFGLAKLLLLLVFASALGSAGLFASWTVPVLVSLVPVNVVIFSRFIPRHVQAHRDTQQAIDRRVVRKYMAGDFLSDLFGHAMTTLVPVLVVSTLGNLANAYYYTAQTISFGIDLVAWNLANSLTAEASHAVERTRAMARSVVRSTFTLVVPLVVVMVVAAPWLLDIFGPQYARHGTMLLRLLLLASLPRIIMVVFTAVARVEQKTHRNAAVSSVQAVLMIGAAFPLMGWLGVVGVGWATLGAQLIVSAALIPWFIRLMRR